MAFLTTSLVLGDVWPNRQKLAVDEDNVAVAGVPHIDVDLAHADIPSPHHHHPTPVNTFHGVQQEAISERKPFLLPR